MKKLVLLLSLSAILCSGCGIALIPVVVIAPVIVFDQPELTIYQIASHMTGCPENILRGLRFAESTNGVNTKHPDPLDIGDYALHETPELHAERARKWGEYNPWCPLQSAIIAGHIIMENLEIMGNERDAIAAYKQGRHGVYRDGREEWYVDRVLNAI